MLLPYFKKILCFAVLHELRNSSSIVTWRTLFHKSFFLDYWMLSFHVFNITICCSWYLLQFVLVSVLFQISQVDGLLIYGPLLVFESAICLPVYLYVKCGICRTRIVPYYNSFIYRTTL